MNCHCELAAGLPPLEQSQRHRLVRAYAEVVKPSGCLSTAGDDSMYAARLTITLPTGR